MTDLTPAKPKLFTWKWALFTVVLALLAKPVGGFLMTKAIDNELIAVDVGQTWTEYQEAMRVSLVNKCMKDYAGIAQLNVGYTCGCLGTSLSSSVVTEMKTMPKSKGRRTMLIEITSRPDYDDRAARMAKACVLTK